MKAMIFAAGFGSRLRPLTLTTPKPLLKVQNTSIIKHIILNLIHYGFNDIIINTHHLHKEIEKYFKSNEFEAEITLIYEDEILGTGGGLLSTKNFWNDEDFYLCNGDILCNADLKEFIEFHKQSNCTATLATNNRKSSSMLLIDEDDWLVGLKRDGVENVYMNVKGSLRPVGFCGLHCISPLIFNYFSTPISFSIVDEYMLLLKRGLKIRTWGIGNAYWEDIGTPESLESAKQHFPGLNYASS